MRSSALVLTLLLGFMSGAALAGDSVLLIYDVRDLLHPPKDFPAPKLGLDGLDQEPIDAFGDDDEDNLSGAIITADALVELIETHIQPERWAQPGNSVRVHNGNLIIVADKETHAKISAGLNRWRVDGRPSTYAIEVRVRPADAALLKSLGFVGKSRRNSRAIGAKVLQRAIQGRDSKPHELPRLTVLEGQTSHVLCVEQSAYIADAKVDEKTGVVDPTIAVLNEGVTFEATVRKRGSKRLLVTWKAQVARASASEFENLNGANVELPELEITALHGRSVVKKGRTLVIRGLPHPDGETDGEFVWMIDITEVEQKRKKTERL